jgi:hypothetical protein
MTGNRHHFFARSDYIVGVTLASLHIVLCYWVFASATEGSWGGFLVALVDLPISIPLDLVAQRLGGNAALIVGGTVWWFCLGVALSKGARFLFSRLRARSL